MCSIKFYQFRSQYIWPVLGFSILVPIFIFYNERTAVCEEQHNLKKYKAINRLISTAQNISTIQLNTYISPKHFYQTHRMPPDIQDDASKGNATMTPSHNNEKTRETAKE